MDLSSLIPPHQYRYYYHTLPREESEMYSTLLAGLLQYSKEIKCSGCTVSQIQRIYRYLRLDIPELFFVKRIKINYKRLDSIHCTVVPDYRFTICQSYNTLMRMYLTCKDLIDQYYQSSDFQKEKAIHDFLASTFSYQDSDAPYSHEAPGVILFQIGVCEGIAKACKFLSDHLGLKSIVVFGSSLEQGNEGRHAWNLVNVGGVFYHLDITFDSTISKSCIRYDYYNLSDADILASHTWEELLPTCPSTCGVYERTNCCFNCEGDLISFIKRASLTKKTIVFKIPRVFNDNEFILDSIEKLLQSNIQWGLNKNTQCYFTYNLNQFVFQIDFS